MPPPTSDWRRGESHGTVIDLGSERPARIGPARRRFASARGPFIGVRPCRVGSRHAASPRPSALERATRTASPRAARCTPAARARSRRTDRLAPQTTLNANSTTMAANHAATSCMRETFFNMIDVLFVDVFVAGSILLARRSNAGGFSCGKPGNNDSPDGPISTVHY